MIAMKAGVFAAVQARGRSRDLEAAVAELLAELEGECATLK